MLRGGQLRQEAAQVRGRIDRHACLIRRRIDDLLLRARALARSPAALPVAFVAGMLAGHVGLPGIRRAGGFLTSLMGPASALQAASSFISPSTR